MNTKELKTRRDFFNWGINGLGATALSSLLASDVNAGLQSSDERGFPNFAAKAKRAIHICLVGGMSHIDSFDYKPELTKLHGKSLKTDEQPDIFFGQVGLLRKEDWQFKPRGQSGLMISEMFPRIAELGDELTILRSMVSQSANHTPGLFVANSGFEFNGYPSMGSWIAYGLGSESEELPAYVVLNDERGAPNTGASTWSSAFLPASNQGVVLQNGRQPVRDLFPARPLDAKADQATRDFIDRINSQHVQQMGGDAILSARLRSYQLAAKMQLSIPGVADINRESQKTQEDYGVHDKKTADMGRRCLLGRRLLEKGVRFVQLFSGGPIGGNPRASWDAHENVKDNHSLEAGRIDR
ncbi:MAG: DUF1501 domain-containing protein, partial [Planctomycetota bacterium]|nr:DUF1501 domain-containing protein [Planctomycetota bacterium]